MSVCCQGRVVFVVSNNDDYHHDVSNGGMGWFAGSTRCQVCRNEHTAVLPVVVSDLFSECPACGNMSSLPITAENGDTCGK